MKKKSLISFLIGIFLFIMPVYAAEITNVEIIDGDIVHITSSGSVQKYCIGSKVGAGTCYDSTLNDVKISAKNGHQVLWVVDANGTSSSPKEIDVVNSCDDIVVSNSTGSGTHSRCFKTKSPYETPVPETSGEGVSCAYGYSLNRVQSIMQSDNCALKAGGAKQVLGGVRYCTRVYAYACETSGYSSSLLSSLTVSGVILSPSFNSNVTKYAAVVDSIVDTVTINATPRDSRASFADGLGPRTVKLNYGKNKISIKVISSSGESTQEYVVEITRKDARSTNNNLRSLTVDNGSLSPAFSANTIKYKVSVAENVEVLKIGASLADQNSSFVNEYGPRSVKLNHGDNNIQIKVKSEAGTVRTYTIVVNRAGGDTTPANPGTSVALLKSLVLNDGQINLEFDKNIFNYNINVANDITNILIAAESEDASDAIVVEGGNDLQVGENEIKITVSNANGKSNIYTLYIVRKDEEETISSNNYLTDLIVKGKNIKFDAKEHEYNISLKEKETELDITAVPADENSVITVEGNENLKVGSQIKITVTAEDGTSQEYYLNITGIKKNANIFLIIIVVIIIILVIAYLLLRIMGYKIYFNFDAIKEMFGSKNKKKKKN